MREARRVFVTGGRYAFTCWVPPARNPFMALDAGIRSEARHHRSSVTAWATFVRFGEPAECERTVQRDRYESRVHNRAADQMDWILPEQVVPIITGSTARLAPMLSLQAPEQRREVERAITEGARQYLKAGRVSVPAPHTR